MNRRYFLKNAALAAALVGISPSLSAASNQGSRKKKILFVLRGVSYTDAFNAFKKFNISSELSFHIQKTNCSNQTYSHAEGMDHLMKGLQGKKYQILESQKQDRHKIADVIEDSFKSDQNLQNVIYLHHTEIAHSSSKLYMERLDEFFTVLSRYFEADKHKIIITADIGRNEKANSCGGRDHSNSSSLESFAIFMGGKAAKLSANNNTLQQEDVFKQKF